MTVIRVGTDILEIRRIASVLERHGDRFVCRILSPPEVLEYSQHSQPVRFLAKRFAAKEAIGKALGTGIGQGVSWQDIQLEHDKLGAPLVKLSNRAREVAKAAYGTNMLISLSDEKEYVLAFACLVSGEIDSL
ncbi:MAG: holo-[acyl-carrier protein] synthase [Halieaceae bacterium]